LSSDSNHCGKCDKRCNANRVCQSGACEKLDDKGSSAQNDTAGLRILLALFGLSLEDLARAMGVPVEDLENTPITLTDLQLLGVSIAALGLLGIGIDALSGLGIHVSS
jgi:hypothetical protein